MPGHAYQDPGGTIIIQLLLQHLPAALRLALFIILLASLVLAGCATRSPGGSTLTVFAAASLTDAFTEIGRAYEATHPGVKVSFNFAGSQQLAQQIALGAPADVFASANEKQLQSAIQAGQVDEKQVRVFAGNRLVVIQPKDNPVGLKKLQDLARPGLKLVLADPSVPAGEYSLEFLDKASQDPAFGANYKLQVLNNVASYEENVRAVLSKVALGEADAGLVYASDVSAAMESRVRYLEVPPGLNVSASYAIAPLVNSPHSHLGQDFIDLVLSNTGQSILSGYGFIPIENP